MLGERGHRVIVFEAADAPGGQIRLAASSPRRRDLISIVDWRLAECKLLDVDIRTNSYAEVDDVLAENPDVVVVATGGVPNTEFLTEGAQLVTDAWDVLCGAARPRGTEPSLLWLLLRLIGSLIRSGYLGDERHCRSQDTRRKRSDLGPTNLN